MLNTAPHDFVVNFSHPVDQTTLEAGDFAVAVGGITYRAASFGHDTNWDTLTFHVPLPPDTAGGTFTMSMTAGSVKSVGSPKGGVKELQAWTADFSYQPAAVAVSKTVPCDSRSA